MFLYIKTNILRGYGIFKKDFAHSHEPANIQCADRGQFTKKSKKPTQRRPPFSIITNLKPT